MSRYADETALCQLRVEILLDAAARPVGACVERRADFTPITPSHSIGVGRGLSDLSDEA